MYTNTQGTKSSDSRGFIAQLQHTDKLQCALSLALMEGDIGEVHGKGGPCQEPTLIPVGEG